ncbi:SMI1/KNR4 family protein [Gibbsiella dentisursi]|uniref:SMI1/KNR4 family protein n=1 Tax=Gibbsiella dentisursi TaxID=796890 RepID=A0ABP7L7E9_9GAMM
MRINISKIHEFFKLEVKNPGDSSKKIKIIKNFFSGEHIPEEYVYFISQVSEAEILVQSKSYIRIWGAEGCIEMNESYHIQKYIPDAIAIGDDEGGQVIFYATGGNGYGLYKVGFGNLDIEDATFISNSLYDLLMKGNGADNLIS